MYSRPLKVNFATVFRGGFCINSIDSASMACGLASKCGVVLLIRRLLEDVDVDDKEKEGDFFAADEDDDDDGVEGDEVDNFS